MRIKMFALIFALLLSPISSQAGDLGWRHIDLRSEQGMQIRVNFRVECQVYSLGRVLSAPEVWVEATHPHIHKWAHVRAVFNSGKRSGEPMQGKIFDLEYRGGEKASAPYPYGYSNELGAGTWQELSVVLSDSWQTDPISHTNNFRFSMFDLIGSVGQGCP
jgi:hypothetical protein